MYVRLSKEEWEAINGEPRDGDTDVELNTIEDSDKFTRPYCTLVLNKKENVETRIMDILEKSKRSQNVSSSEERKSISDNSLQGEKSFST